MVPGYGIASEGIDNGATAFSLKLGPACEYWDSAVRQNFSASLSNQIRIKIQLT